MRLALPAWPDQTSSLQHILHPAVAPPNIMFFSKFLVKMPHVEVVVLVSIEREYLFHLHRWRLLPIGLPLTFVEQGAESMFLVSILPPTHRSGTHAQDFRRLPPGNLPGHRPQNHFLHLHCSLRFSRRNLLHAVLRLEASNPSGSKAAN